MNNYLHPLNSEVYITPQAKTLAKRAPDTLKVEEQAERFGEWLREARGKAGMSKAELARAAKIARSYVTNLEGAIKNVLTDKPTVPKVEIVDRIAEALGASASEARFAAGYAPTQIDERPADIADIELQRLNHYYKELPRECQLDFLALAESLWHRRRALGRVERSASRSSGKHRPETVKPGVERKRTRKAS
jgi:transcriptional regulator with XRE-family HTH domain